MIFIDIVCLGYFDCRENVQIRRIALDHHFPANVLQRQASGLAAGLSYLYESVYRGQGCGNY